MRTLRFFPYFGAKASRWKRYPAPRHDAIVEPFAGSAAYSVGHHERQVMLYDLCKNVVKAWQYLISVPEDEFLGLPTIDDYDRVSEVADDLPDGAVAFLRFWAGDASTGRDKVSPIMRGHSATGRFCWDRRGKPRIAERLKLIRHWKAERLSYVHVPNRIATWFVDPPYQEAGKNYRHGSKGIDYAHLASWCRRRLGQTIVCENVGAAWLPFGHLPASRRNSNAKQLGTGRQEAVWMGSIDEMSTGRHRIAECDDM